MQRVSPPLAPASLGRVLTDPTRDAPQVAERVVTVSPHVASSTNTGGWINKVGLLGELGSTWSTLGQPLLPVGTVYDPFVGAPWTRRCARCRRTRTSSSSAAVGCAGARTS